MRAFDTHCHLDLPAFDADRDEVWSRATAAGVVGAVVPAVSPRGWRRALGEAREGARWAALGVHPHALPSLDDRALRDALSSLEQTIRAQGRSVVAVGECGLDATLDPAAAPLPRQREALAAQVEVAAALDLPLVLHVRGAHAEALEALASQRLPSRPGVVHSYSGGAELARAYLSLGFHLGFGGAITRPGSRRPVEALRATPRDRLLVETDAPDQLPCGVERPGGRCEPADVVVILRRAAALRGEGEALLGCATEANARALFGV